MPGVDGPVCLTRSAPTDAYAGSLMFFDVVPPENVSRSGVLSSIVEAGGDARLPQAVTLSEFKAWNNTKLDPRSVFIGIPLACSVLKVADALDDRQFNDWLNYTAEAIRTDAIRRYESAVHKPENSSDSVFSLPEHLQCRLIEQVLQSKTSAAMDNLGALLSAWPGQHHAAVVAAAITSDKTLSAPGNQLLPVAGAIASLPASPPSLIQLRVEGGMFWKRSTDSPDNDDTAEIAAALRHHSGLTLLSIANFDYHPAVANAIASLTSLQTLHLGGAAFKVQLGVVPDLKVILDSLPCLQDLMLTMSARTAVEFPQKRSFDDYEADHCGFFKDPQVCLASLLSGATALTSLNLREWQGRQNFIASAPLTLPCLKHLMIDSDCIATALLSKLSAPLATLEVQHMPKASLSLQLDDLIDAQPLWASLSNFQQLRAVHVTMEINRRNEATNSAIREGPAAALAALPSLHELKIGTSLYMLLCTLQQLVRSESPVKRLFLTCPDRYDYDTAGDSPAAWGELLGHLSQLRLQCLEIHTRGLNETPRLPGIAALRPLTQLTSLALHGWRDCLRLEGDCEALAGMQLLRSVSILGVGEDYAPAVRTACVRALGQLSCLTELSVQPPDNAKWCRNDWVTTALAEHVKPAMWPALQKLFLPAESVLTVEQVLGAVGELPALQMLAIREMQSHSMHRMEDDSYWDRLKQRASDSGVGLSVHPSPRWW